MIRKTVITRTFKFNAVKNEKALCLDKDTVKNPVCNCVIRFLYPFYCFCSTAMFYLCIYQFLNSSRKEETKTGPFTAHYSTNTTQIVL